MWLVSVAEKLGIEAPKIDFLTTLKAHVRRQVASTYFWCLLPPNILCLCITGLWTFLWFVGFCYMTDAWRRRDETPWAIAPHGHGKDNVQAAIAFSFFSIITWVNIIMWNYSRRNRKIIFLFLNQNICCGYSKESAQRDSSFEHPKHMQKIMDKKILTILR